MIILDAELLCNIFYALHYFICENTLHALLSICDVILALKNVVAWSISKSSVYLTINLIQIWRLLYTSKLQKATDILQNLNGCCWAFRVNRFLSFKLKIERGLTETFRYLFICWSSRVRVFLLCWQSIASGTSKADISASIICLLCNFISVHWYISKPLQSSYFHFGGLSYSSNLYGVLFTVNDSEVANCGHEHTPLFS